MEVVFRSQYLLRKDPVRPLSLQAKRSFSSVDDFDLLIDDPLVFNPSVRPPRNRSKSVGVPSVLASELLENNLNDGMAIVWLEDIHNLAHLVTQLPKQFAGCIMVHPLPHTAGLYSIRLFFKAGTPEECFVIPNLIVVSWASI